MEAPRIRSVGLITGLLVGFSDPRTLPEFIRLARDPGSVPMRDFEDFHFGVSSVEYGDDVDLFTTLVRDSTSCLEARRFLKLMVGFRPQYADLRLAKDSLSSDTSYTLSYNYSYRHVEIAVGVGYSWRTRTDRSFFLLGGGQMDLGTSVTTRMEMQFSQVKRFDEWSSIAGSSWNGKAIGTTTLHAWVVGEVGFRIAKRVEYAWRFMLGNGLRWYHGERVEFIPLCFTLGNSLQWVFRR